MLTTRSPTPTTVLYKVSTRSTSHSLPSKAFRSLSILLRILASLLILLLLLQEYHTTFPHHHPGIPTLTKIFAETEDDCDSGLLQSKLKFPYIGTLPWRLAFCLVTLYLVSRKGYTEESLLVIRGLGVQTTTSSGSYFSFSFGREEQTRFIPSSSIQDIWIHEAFRGFGVRFYLCIVVEGEEDVVVVFPSILPRREILEQVWRGARACLYEPKT